VTVAQLNLLTSIARVHADRADAPAGDDLDLRRRSLQRAADRTHLLGVEGSTTVPMVNHGISTDERRDARRWDGTCAWTNSSGYWPADCGGRGDVTRTTFPGSRLRCRSDAVVCSCDRASCGLAATVERDLAEDTGRRDIVTGKEHRVAEADIRTVIQP
jgi:hypothetical protein